jgi:hypothetical protein
MIDPNDIKIYDTPELYERFRKEYFGLNPKGDMNNAWGNLKAHAQYGSRDKNGEFITLDALIASYKEYMNWWNRTYGDKDEKYISKEDRLADPEYFVLMKLYCSSWHTTATKRDDYLFGSMSDEYLKARTEEFLNASPKIKKT